VEGHAEDLRLLGYRLDRLEERVRGDYLTEEHAVNRFVTREELERSAKVRREWWPIMLMALAGIPGTVNLILTLKGGR